MVHLLAEPKDVVEVPDRSRRESLFGLCVESMPTRAIAGGSEEGDGDHPGRVSSRPPI